jgi:hypothetical protein
MVSTIVMLRGSGSSEKASGSTSVMIRSGGFCNGGTLGQFDVLGIHGCDFFSTYRSRDRGIPRLYVTS